MRKRKIMDTVGREKRIETVEKENEKSNIDTKKESYLRRKRQKGGGRDKE